jgi:hypothetical protein
VRRARQPEPAPSNLAAHAASADVLTVKWHEYAPIVIDAGSALDVVMFRRTASVVAVKASSAATISARPVGTPVFATRASQAHWLALKRRSRGQGTLRLRPSTMHIPVGQFDFLPTGGPVLTFADAASLSDQPLSIAATVRAHIAAPPDAITSAVLLREYSFLLGWAPLKPAARAGVVLAIAHTPGIHVCSHRPASPRRAVDYCATDSASSISSVLNRTTDRVTLVVMRLPVASPLYPGLKPGTVIQRDSFQVVGQ